MKKKLLIGVFILPLTLLSLTACSNSSSKKPSEKTSQSQKSEKLSKDFQKVVDASKKEMAKNLDKKTYSKIQVKGEAPETIVFTYTFKEEKEKTLSTKEMKEGLIEGARLDFESQGEKFPNFKERLIYLNPDGSTLYNITISAKDIKEAEESSDETSDNSSDDSKKDLSQISADDYNPNADTTVGNYPAADYNALSRTPETFEGKQLTVSGRVIQATDPGKDEFATVLVDTDGADGDGVSHLVEVAVEAGYFSANRILEGDDIVVHGIGYGIDSYDSVGNGTMSVPVAVARFYELTPAK